MTFPHSNLTILLSSLQVRQTIFKITFTQVCLCATSDLIRISSRACARIRVIRISSAVYEMSVNTFGAGECRVFLTLESQLSFQRGGAGPADRGFPGAERLWLRRGGEQHDDPRAAGDELQSEPEPADHLGAVLVDFVVAPADEGSN